MSRPPTFTPPPSARARALRTARGEFAVLEALPAGEPRADALMLPGYTGSKEDFIALLEPLAAAGYRVVSVDGRGQYETPGPDDPQAYAQGELARDVLAQAEAVRDGGGHARPLHLLGHSLGGQIARAAVLLDAAPFASLTLVSSGPAQIAPSQQQKVKLLGEALATMSMAEVWEAMQAFEPPEDAAAEAGNGADLRRRWLRHTPAQLLATGRQLTAEPDRVGELAAVRGLPKHVLSGERDDTWPVSLLDAMAERLGARRTVIAGADHSPNTDRPAQTAEAVAAFWERCDAPL
ncbi:alpha/beta hydrolase [Streptomyces sp. HNM0663]|uniref:Alpha/beta hydrolase n=1 Tax=Streptomyces chengmaiensis TaxID=3040919 RepID=A0ABT6HWW3_9ACTN|nr:alpha/beta hydrolase [Streptomyces chengmaiensis]MDH2392890.1 alpha/beta hydrolase [Streptomyces chengmaiensis]